MASFHRLRDRIASWFGRAPTGSGTHTGAPACPEAFCLGLPARPLATFAPIDRPVALASPADVPPACAERLRPLIEPVRSLWPERGAPAQRGLRIIIAPAAVAQISQGRNLVTRGDRLLPVMRQPDGSRLVSELDRVELRDHAAMSAAFVALWQTVARAAGRELLVEIDARLNRTEQTLARATGGEAAEARRRLEPCVAFLRMAIARIRACAPPGGEPPAGGPQFEVVELDAVAAGEAAFKGLQRVWTEISRIDASAFWAQPEARTGFAGHIDDWMLGAELFAAAQYTSIVGCGVRALSPTQEDPFDRRLREIEARLGKLAANGDAMRQAIAAQRSPLDNAAPEVAGGRNQLIDLSIDRIRTAEAWANELIEMAKRMAKQAPDPLSLQGGSLGLDLKIAASNEVVELRWGRQILPPLAAKRSSPPGYA